MARPADTVRRHLAAVRVLLVLTVLLGVLYPLAVTALAQLPGLKGRADGSMLTADGRVVGSRLVGQAFTTADGTPLVQYLQSRPSAAGTAASGYDPTASGASNLGPESVLDVLADWASGTAGSTSLLTRVCSRSLAVGRLEGVDGSRPFCTAAGTGAVLVVLRAGPGSAARGQAGPVTRVVSADQACPAVPFLATYQGVRVTCARPGEDLSAGQVVPVRGSAPARPAVPADAVTASASGLDPGISPAYARMQAPRVARARHVPVAVVLSAIARHETGRALGFLGEPAVDVLQVNTDLDAVAPYRT